MRPGGVRKEPVPQPAKPLRASPSPPALPAHRLLSGHRAAVFRPPGRQDAHRDAAPRHAALGLQLQLAVHAHRAARPAHLPPLQRERALKVERKRRSCGRNSG